MQNQTIFIAKFVHNNNGGVLITGEFCGGRGLSWGGEQPKYGCGQPRGSKPGETLQGPPPPGLQQGSLQGPPPGLQGPPPPGVKLPDPTPAELAEQRWTTATAAPQAKEEPGAAGKRYSTSWFVS